MDDQHLTPSVIKEELDRYVIGQDEAKKAVAIALRNRWRRLNIKDENLRDDIIPKNILMIGPTGCGKTEIARKLAKLTQSPFIKVEATKFTEIGYVGRDVEQIIRDLIEVAINLEKKKIRDRFIDDAKLNAEETVLKALLGDNPSEETKEKFYIYIYRKIHQNGCSMRSRHKLFIVCKLNSNSNRADCKRFNLLKILGIWKFIQI